MPIATRLTTAGTLLVNGSFDENTSIAPSKFRTTSNTVFASEFDEFTGAPVVDSSLKLWLDAAQTTSYSGSGSTWTDLSGNGNNGTLVNSPSFISTDGGGCIQLDGTNDHITLPTTGFAPASLTIDYWIKRISDEGYIWVIDNSDQPELRLIFQSGKLQIYFYDDGGYFSTALSTTTFSTGSWYNITATLTNGSQNVYINGNQEILTTTGTYTGNSGGNAGEHTLGTYNRPSTGYGGYANVRIGSYKFYNRVLTAAEITQNYNALQSRYGLASITTTQMPVVQRQQSSGTLLVNGEFDEFTGAPVVDSSLKLWLDAAQTTSYSGSGSTWTDLSGNGNNGTLTNTQNFSTTNGGQFAYPVTPSTISGTEPWTRLPDSLMNNRAAGTISFWLQYTAVTRISNYHDDYGQALTGRQIDGTGTWAVLSVSGFVNSGGSPVLGTTGKIYWHPRNGIVPANSTANLAYNTIYNVVMTFNSSQCQFYINGALDSTTSGDYSVSSSSTAINGFSEAIFLYGGEYYMPWSGFVYQMMVYNRALTTDEITTNFNALRGRYGI